MMSAAELEPPTVDVDGMSDDELVRAYLDSLRGPSLASTKQLRRHRAVTMRDFLEFRRGKRLPDATRTEIGRFVSGHLVQGTRSSRHRQLRDFYRFLVDIGRLETSPVEDEYVAIPRQLRRGFPPPDPVPDRPVHRSRVVEQVATALELLQTAVATLEFLDEQPRRRTQLESAATLLGPHAAHLAALDDRIDDGSSPVRASALGSTVARRTVRGR
jgi:hypothetical protein